MASGGLASASSMKLSGEIARTSSSLINAQFSQPSIPCFFLHEEISLKIHIGWRGKGMPEPSSAQLRSCMNLSRPLHILIFRFFFPRQSANSYDATYTGKCLLIWKVLDRTRVHLDEMLNTNLFFRLNYLGKGTGEVSRTSS